MTAKIATTHNVNFIQQNTPVVFFATGTARTISTVYQNTTGR